MPAKQLWLLVGGNGAGKSTFYNTRLAPLGIPFVNADLIAKELYPESPELHSYQASKIAEEMRNSLLIEGRTFCFETVFSHSSKIDFVGRAKALGYQIILVFIHLEQPSLNKARVFQRVELGGHHVPDEKLEGRIPRLMDNVKTAIPLCEHVTILNNSYADDPFQMVVTVKNGFAVEHIAPLPGWAKYVL